jgi:ATP phosphoribosyltransferase
MSRYEFAVKAVQILGLRVKVIGLPASEIYQSAQRPRDSSLISIRHNLPVRNVEEGLWYLRHRINEFYRNESFCQEIGMEPTKGVKGPIFWLPWGLIPAVIQDYETGEVLMVGYMNHEAWELTLREGRMHYYSRKKRRIWLKGEQSGHYQFVKEVFLNCDNTCLLFKVEQVGGACDLGLRSCFDKVLKGEEFESTGVKVFDPQDVYGERFTQEIRLGIPSGSLEAMTFTLLELAGYEVERESPRSYHPRVINDPDLKLFMARAQELPIIVEQSFLDAAITGLDWVKETGASIRDICDLGYNKSGLGSVALVLAVSDRVALNSLKELEGKRVATTYPNLTRQFFSDRGISITIITSAGATEGKVPFLADAVVELVETGETLRANHLKPILKLCETSAHLIANNESWGYTWKRRRLEEIADRMTSAAGKLPQNPKRKIELPTSEASL